MHRGRTVGEVSGGNADERAAEQICRECPERNGGEYRIKQRAEHLVRHALNPAPQKTTKKDK